MTERPTCPICRSTAVLRDSFSVRDDRYGYPGEWQPERCATCGHRFLKAHFDEQALTRLYSDYYPRSSLDVTDYRPPREVHGITAWLNGSCGSAFRWVPPRVRVLDIGCGFCESLGYHQARGCEAYGVEADENARRAAEHFGYNVHIGLFDPSVYEPDFFDYVTMDQVIEHVTDPLQSLRDVHQVLRPGGKAILSTPNANGWGAPLFRQRWINWHTPYHLQLFSRESMRRAAEQAGLVLESARTITSSDWLHFQWLHLVYYPQPGTPSAFWSSRTAGELPLYRRAVLKLLPLLQRARINHLITRLLDAVQRGDNSVFVLRKPA